MPPLILPLICALSLIVLVFLYIFLFRLPSAQLQSGQRQRLKELYADEDPDTERSSLILTSRSLDTGGMEAQLVWLDGYEVLDPIREIPSDSYEAYQERQGIRWRQDWVSEDAAQVQLEIRAAYEQKIMEIQVTGWLIALEIQFSDQDRLVYLQRQRARSAPAVSSAAGAD